MAEKYPSRTSSDQSPSPMENQGETLDQHGLVGDQIGLGEQHGPVADQTGSATDQLAQFGLDQESALQVAHETGKKLCNVLL